MKSGRISGSIILSAGVFILTCGCKSVEEDKTATYAPAQQESFVKKDLPYAEGRAFKTLDDYLAFRKQLGAMDRPFYEEISPGVYRLVSGQRLPGAPVKTYTRKQLLDKFGFSR